jgi:two-component system, OmpR family, sensor kinase
VASDGAGRVDNRGMPPTPSVPASQLRAWRPLRSVRSRILATTLVVTAAGMLVAGATAYLVQRERVLASVDDRLSTTVDEVVIVVAETPGATVDTALSALVQRIRPGTGEGTFAITTVGTALVPGGEVDVRLESDALFVSRVQAETVASGAVIGTAQTSDGLMRYAAVPVGGDSATAEQRGIFVFAVDLDAALTPITEAFRTFAIVALGALLVVGLAGWFVAGRLLAPIRRLRETATRITASDVSERIEVTGTDDVSELTRTVNGMLDRLDGALTGQRQLLDDVGHELKTPITIVRGHLELMDSENSADVAATRALAIDELDRMSGLVRDIADLAQAQRGLRLSIETTDIAALLERVRRKAEVLSPALRWTTAIPTRLEGRGLLAEVDADRLTQALLQLAANAVTHAGAATAVELGASADAVQLRLWMRDDGVGIPVETQAVIFERFQRGKVGRGSAGSGLGLAIVAAIARAHGGEVRVESPPGGGATFTIELPRSAEPMGEPE